MLPQATFNIRALATVKTSYGFTLDDVYPAFHNKKGRGIPGLLFVEPIKISPLLNSGVLIFPFGALKAPLIFPGRLRQGLLFLLASSA